MTNFMTQDQIIQFDVLYAQAIEDTKHTATAVGAYAPVYNYLIEYFAPAVSAIIELNNEPCRAGEARISHHNIHG